MLGWIWRELVGNFRASPPPPKCAHSWGVYRTYKKTVTERATGSTTETGEAFVLRCNLCGDMKNHEI